MQYDDMVVRNSQAIGRTESGFFREQGTGFTQEDAFQWTLSYTDTKVRKYIAFHDTTTYEYNGEGDGHRGLWYAIEEFLDENKDWVIAERFEHCNGLTVLKKR